MAFQTDASQKYNALYANVAKRTLEWQDYRGVDWPEKDWFPAIGSCELLINNVKGDDTFSTLLAVLRRYFSDSPQMKFYFVEEEFMGGGPPRDYEYFVEDLEQIEQSDLYRSTCTSVLFDERYTCALKLHHEGFAYFSGPKQVCNSVRGCESLAPLIKDVRWREQS